MLSIDDLSNYIAADDYKGFLRCYFLIIDGGQNLSLPASLELPGIREGWSEILPEIVGGYTDEFIDGLSQYWHQIVKKQGGTIDDNFSKQILALIDGQPMPKAAAVDGPDNGSDGPSPAAKKKSPSAPSPSNNDSDESESGSSSGGSGDTSNPTVESQISQSYYHFQAATEFRTPEPKKLQQLLDTAIENEDALTFMVYHLASIRKSGKASFPMSSVMPTIVKKWEEVLMEDYGIQPELTFVKAVASQWFGAVNLKGLPASKEKTEEIFNHFVQALQKKEAESKPKIGTTAKTPPKPKPLFSKLKSIFKK